MSASKHSSKPVAGARNSQNCAGVSTSAGEICNIMKVLISSSCYARSSVAFCFASSKFLSVVFDFASRAQLVHGEGGRTNTDIRPLVYVTSSLSAEDGTIFTLTKPPQSPSHNFRPRPLHPTPFRQRVCFHYVCCCVFFCNLFLAGMETFRHRLREVPFFGPQGPPR